MSAPAPDPLVDENGWRWPPLDPVRTGVLGRCPRCGQGRLFKGFLTLADRCGVCGLDYSYADPADGPAVFVQLFACVPGVVFILMLQVIADPPWWVHLLVSVPVLALSTVLPLRPLKGWLVSSQFFYRAREGRIVRD